MQRSLQIVDTICRDLKKTRMIKDEDFLKSRLRMELVSIADYDFKGIIEEKNVGLFHGLTGMSLFYYFLYKKTKHKLHYQKAFSFFETAFSNMNPLNLNLSFGTSGIMWLLNIFCRDRSLNLDYEDYLNTYDAVLKKRLSEYNDDIDPMHGLLSIANYLLSRNNKVSDDCIAHIINIVDYKKIANEKGIVWETNNYDKSDTSRTHINFGFGHGVLSILAFLTKFENKNIEAKKCHLLYKSGMDCFLSYQQFDGDTYFPTRVQEGIPTRGIRVAYCYGDLGLAIGLYSIGKMREDSSLINLSKKLSINVSEISLRDTFSIDDIGLCHGASGNGYMFNRLFRVHKSNVLKRAATKQFESLLQIKKDGTGILGYTSKDYDNIKERYYQKTDPGFINGVAGVGLSILSYLEPRSDSSWDSILYFR